MFNEIKRREILKDIFQIWKIKIKLNKKYKIKIFLKWKKITSLKLVRK